MRTSNNSPKVNNEEDVLATNQAAANSLQNDILTLRNNLQTYRFEYVTYVASVTDNPDFLERMEHLHNEIISTLRKIQDKRTLLATYKVW